MRELLADEAIESFSRDGYLAPVPLLTAAQCRLTMDLYRGGDMAGPAVWEKGLAASERLIFDLATRPELIRWLRRLLGFDVILWGATFCGRPAGAVHPWHSDIESSAPQGRFVSVWIGLENASAETGLKVVQGSHRFGRTVQEVQAEKGVQRGEAPDEQILEWSREFDPAAEIVSPEVKNGSAIFFDGRLWHCGANERGEGTRMALLLQFARGDTSVYMPDLDRLEWPNRLIVDRRPPVLVVSGKADKLANDVVPAPSCSPRKEPARVSMHSLDLPLGRDPEKGWKPHFLAQGPTPVLPNLGCHVSVLEPGHCPHPPHAHIEEELLIVLDGTAEILLAESAEDPKPRCETLKAGDFIYHPAFQYHTLRNRSDAPITYLMYKWRSAPREVSEPLTSRIVRLDEFSPPPDAKPFHPRLLFEKPTIYLSKLHAHVTDLRPGAGYEAHADAYDVGIVLLKGEVTVLGEVLRAPAVAFFGKGEQHDMKNTGSEPARYLVFEFHGENRTGGDENGDAVAPATDSEAQSGELAALRSDLEDSLARNTELRETAAKLQRNLDLIRASPLWRYSAPLRWTHLWMKRRRRKWEEEGNYYSAFLGKSVANTAAVCAIRDAADMVSYSCGHYLRIGFSHIRFLDDGSTDGTFEALEKIAARTDRISVQRLNQANFEQSAVMTVAANELIDKGYRLIFPFDSDEFWNLSKWDLRKLAWRNQPRRITGQWTNFVQSRAIRESNPANDLEANYRISRDTKANHEEVTEFRKPWIFILEKKVAFWASKPVEVTTGNHGLKKGPPEREPGEFEVFHLPLRSRAELEKRGLNYDARRAARRRNATESWQSAFHREVVTSGRVDEVWAANSVDENGRLDVYGKPVQLSVDGRLSELLRSAARHMERHFGTGVL